MARQPHFKLIDLPCACDHELYSRTLEKVVDALVCHDFVDSVYQVGSVRHPGISDIDVLVVVDDVARSDASPLGALSEAERRLFSHSCFLVPQSLAAELGTYALLHGYHRLYGAFWAWPQSRTELLSQAATEFLVKNLLDVYVQIEYRVIKVRALLQHLKGLRLDLDLLRITEGPLHELVDNALDLIDEWFETRHTDEHVTELATHLFPLLRDAVNETTQRAPLSSPAPSPLAVAPNMTIESGSTVTLRRRGIRLHALPGLEERRLFNAHHRLNRFQLRLPMRLAAAQSYESDRFDFLRRAKSFVQGRFPAFSAPIPPLFYYRL